MDSSNDNSAQFTSKPSPEIDVTKRNTAVSVAVDEAMRKLSHDDEHCSPPVSKRSKNLSNEGSPNAVTSASTTSPVVVFGINNTLCYSRYLCEDEEEIIRKSFPECSIIDWNEHYGTGEIARHAHVFLPHLKILFDYLLEQSVRIVFFSHAPKERNSTVIPQLLTSFWGSEKFEALKAKGQFDIFSEEHLRKRTTRGEGNKVKDLKVVIRNDETLLDAIVVVDECSYAAHDQKPCLFIIDLSFWKITDKNEMDEVEAKCAIPDGIFQNFPVNSVYYMLGVFKTYFGHEKYKVLPLREGLNQLLPKEARENQLEFFTTHSFADDMINLGLSEVQKLVPDAMYY
ncbi:uncharacterized protein LOC135849421 [Planococcus citri]|uniref:uncharacterized protein LOC135849421 n=1 Tax=Planococcus citri TaxID=170843 RepID=UPI0031F9D74B